MLKYTSGDVRKIFGQPERKRPSRLEYFVLKPGRVSVLYSNGKCIKKVEDGAEKAYGWKVPEGTVTEISIFFQEPVNFKKLKIDLNKLRTYKESDNPTKHYYNDELGIDYTFAEGKFTGITFYPPPDKYDYLLCK